jgi:hypothetical protein
MILALSDFAFRSSLPLPRGAALRGHLSLLPYLRKIDIEYSNVRRQRDSFVLVKFAQTSILEVIHDRFAHLIWTFTWSIRPLQKSRVV